MGKYWQQTNLWEKLKLVFNLSVLILLVIFAVINWQSIELNLIIRTIQIPISFLILICLLVAYLSTSFLDYGKFRKKDREIESLKDEIKRMKSNLER